MPKHGFRGTRQLARQRLVERVPPGLFQFHGGAQCAARVRGVHREEYASNRIVAVGWRDGAAHIIQPVQRGRIAERQPDLLLQLPAPPRPRVRGPGRVPRTVPGAPLRRRGVHWRSAPGNRPGSTAPPGNTSTFGMKRWCAARRAITSSGPRRGVPHDEQARGRPRRNFARSGRCPGPRRPSRAAGLAWGLSRRRSRSTPGPKNRLRASAGLDLGARRTHLPSIRDRSGPNGLLGAMFKLSKLTDYAVVVLVRLARQDGVQTSPGIAAATFIPEPTVAKVLKTLAGKALVTSQRGAHGGYRPGPPAGRHTGGRCDCRDRWPDRADRLRGGRQLRKRAACARCTAGGTR